jgi:hypothetical protein
MIVDVIRDAVSGFSGFRSKKARSQAISELLCIYFVMVDVAKEGRDLLEAVGSNPRVTIAHAPDVERAPLRLEWHGVIRRQASRLSALGEQLLAQDSLAVFDPQLKARLEKIVSSKFKRVRTLARTGAGLVLYAMFFGDPEDEESMRGLILSMYPGKTRVTIDLKAADRELRELSAALEEFRSVCTKLATNDEIFAISKKARRMTQLPGPSRRGVKSPPARSHRG